MAAAISMSGRESTDVAAETVSGIDVPRARPASWSSAVRYQIGPIAAADNRSKSHRPPNSLWRARRSFTPQQVKLHLTKRSGKIKFTRSPRISGGTGGNSGERPERAQAPSPGRRAAPAGAQRRL